MNRMPGSRSRDLRTRVFGAVGPKDPRDRTARPAAYRRRSYRGKSPVARISTKIGLE